jgi:hypothetical protein
MAPGWPASSAKPACSSSNQWPLSHGVAVRSNGVSDGQRSLMLGLSECAQVGGEIVLRGKGVGVVVTQHPATPG